jgi:thioester reductase-like protein
LQQTPASIYCLVRASGIDEGRQRLQKTLTTYELWDESVSARIVPVPGNLSEPWLGLAEEEFSRLAGTLDVIYHNGAQVNLLYPYATLKAPNVLGTQEVLRLACRTQAKPVHYVSTLSVTSSLAHSGEGFHKGYTQTKWVAEQLVMLAGARGLPVSIYRPGQIAGHSQTGACNPDDLLWQMIRGCIRLGSVPDLNDMRVDMTPVDFVSRAIVYLSRQAEASGQTFPLINPHSVPWRELVTWVNALGYPLRQVSYEAWRAELLKAAGQSEENALAFLVPVFSERTTLKPVALQAEAPAPEPEFQTQLALDLLKGASILCPPTNADLMKTYIAYFQRCGFLEEN